MRRQAIALFFAAAVSFQTPVHAQGIPVIDMANLEQALQNIAAWQRQLQSMQQQYEQQVAQFKALTGARGFGDVLNNPLLQKYLPLNWQQVYQGVRSGNMSDVAAAARQQNLIYDCLAQTGQSQQLCRAQLGATYQVRDIFQKAYDTAVAQFDRIAQLQSQIGKTDDPKGIAELQARIGTEQSVLQNAMLQAQLGQQLAEAENKLILQQRAEIAHKAYSAGGALDTQPMNYQR
ncbi:P-type DNA transfer protein VirB5 [Fluviibacter phosphoraccumulans]|uniref:P-type DNA transfer protein VirB5 n=1 Tax=Fluviibacter phosphoraccumulans TaxID=1751046 RepID=A0A7R6QWL4_9RHOO|nr:P-type DNA transfer protein VirB5 [Fluviibacter phosphoraccumulans]BBU68732.1 P-type DNA transfer protein VirB5 [Fluviibacter phosphoraccumulans]BBU72115.1 P-type DNA transfer protein VirB5 [Fluviibacter phosphoraccumulans]